MRTRSDAHAAAAWWILAAVVIVSEVAATDEPDVVIDILSPARGAVLPGGVVHLNYTLSRCPPGAHITVHLDGNQLGGDDSHFWCKPDNPGQGPPRPAGAVFMWHGVTGGLAGGPHEVHVVLHEQTVARAHANVHFEIHEGHGRFFGVNHTTLVDGAGTAAFFLFPANRSVVREDPAGISVELLAQNFLPGRNGYSFRVALDSMPDDVVEAVDTLIAQRLDAYIYLYLSLSLSTSIYISIYI